MRSLRVTGAVLAVPLSLALSGCAGMGGLGGLEDILGGAMGGGAVGGAAQVRAEVQRVDEGSRTIQVTTADGRSGAVRYDQNTTVIYQQQQYPVNALEHGDLVLMHLQQSSSGETYVGRIDVEQSVQDRTGQPGAGQVQIIEGQVGQLYHDQGAFQLRTPSVTVIVTLPYNAAPQTVDRFHRLRQGEHIAIEGTMLAQNRVELHRFR